MKHTPIAEFGQVDKNRRRFVIIADFPPIHSRTAKHAGTTACLLHQTGVEVITASEPPSALARIPLAYNTQKKLAQTRKAIFTAVTRETTLILYPNGLRMDLIAKKSWRARLAERIRRYKLAVQAARRAKSVIIICESANPLRASYQRAFFIRAILALGRTTARITSIKSDTAAVSDAAGTPATELPERPETETLFKLAYGTSGVRMDPTLISLSIHASRNGPVNKELSADLRIVYALTRQLHKINKRRLWPLGECTLPLPLPASREPEHKRAWANFQDGDVLSRFQRHYSATLKDAPTNDQAFAQWYLERDAALPLPLPQTTVDQECAKLTKVDAQTITYIIDLARRGDSVSALPREIHDFLAAPVGKISTNISRMELLCAVACGFIIRRQDTRITPWDSNEIRQWFTNSLCTVTPGLAVFSTSDDTQHMLATPGAKIVGIVDGQTGLARNAEMSANALLRLDIGVTRYSAGNLAHPIGLATKPRTNILKRAIILHNINAHRIPRQILSRELTNGGAPLHIGYLLWELEKIPRSQELAGELLDEIWAPSTFVQQTYATAYGREVHNVGKSIVLPHVGRANLSHLGIQDYHYLFAVIFDSASCIERKNPLAVVRAFLEAFPREKHVRLLVKTTPCEHNARGDPGGQLDRIAKLAALDPRIIIERANVPFYALLARIRRADCVISAHRSEGFGYIPAFALAQERPVISTDYSGTRDFCSRDTAFPVGFKHVEPRAGTIFAETKDAFWAEIDLNDLARNMRLVHDAPTLAGIRARAGSALIRAQYSPTALAERYRRRLVSIGAMDA